MKNPAKLSVGFFSKKLEALFSLPYDNSNITQLLIERLSVFAVDRRWAKLNVSTTESIK